MTLTWIATWQNEAAPDRPVPQAELDAVAEVIAATPGLKHGLLYTPWQVTGLPFDDGPPPALQLQLYFEHIALLEASLGPGGHLQVLTDPVALPVLADCIVSEQAMQARAFDVAQGPDIIRPFCSFLVHYPGPAEDLNLWLRHYIAHHAPVMQRFPGIRGVEVCSRLDWCSALPWDRATHMQRNKVVFDDAEALQAALASEVMQDMRADSARFPAYAGGNAHFPMRTWHITPAKRQVP